MSENADQIFHHGRLYTLDLDQPWASALAIADGRLLAVGSDAEIERHRGPDTVSTDLNGAFVMPGLIDVHNHHALAGRADLYELTFSVTAGYQEILDAVRDYAAALPPDAWVIGGSWGSTLIDKLSREEARRGLDQASGGRPVLLADDSHHNRWANSRALELAGIATGTQDPPGGVIIRDPRTGAPSGVLLEAAGMQVEKAVSATSRMTAEQHLRSSQRGVEVLNSYGVTAFQDASVSLDILSSLKTLDERADLNAWVVSSMTINDQIFGFDPIGDDLIVHGEEYRSTHHRPDFVKIFLDGVPPAHTGAFLEPYLPDEVHGDHFHGRTTISADELLAWLHKTAEKGISAKIHCTGDASVRMVLDAVEVIRSKGFTAPRYQIAHGQFVHPDDIARFAALDVAADISPFLWFPGVIPEAIAAVIPAEVAVKMQPNRDLIDSGALVAGGSDWPVSESPNVWEGIQGLVTRADPTGNFPGRLWPEQAISLEEAIAVFTLNAAIAMGLGGVTGSLEAGKSADFIMLDRNPFEIDPATLIQTKTGQTWFAGRLVYA